MPSVIWRCWLGGRKGIRPVKKQSGGVLAWLSVWNEMQTFIWPSWCHCHSLSLASVKSRLVLPFWYRLTRVVLDKGPLNACVCVCVYDRRTAWQASVCSVYHIWQYANDISDRSDWTFRNNVQLLCLSTSVSSKVIATVINVTVTLKYCTIHEYIAISVEMRVSL